ncbi:Fic family protein [Acidipropionibacterium timonense]|uniref:Fic family protein n=1 Tax=Acidipropionibacterium timonense TaxID=2161818 RepID=UPI0010300CE8|nr:Fic family protein [Acidipropionibacterium timonense]
MEASDFVDSAFGAPSREPGNKWAFTYYKPKPIPRDIQLTGSVIKILSEADAALGTLAGLGSLVSDPASLIGPYATREALASSQIEGTQASLSDVMQAEVVPEGARSDDIEEVRAYLSATRLANKLSDELPITGRLILKVHATLLAHGRGAEKNPGEFRRSPVWVGSSNATPETAAYVPPLPDDIPDLLADWERFVNNEDESDLPVLVRAALMHYQFETIHPFLDGNGRIGRLLINIMLRSCGRLPHPLLYLSNYFETHRHEYYSSLQGVREKGDIDTWMTFFLRAVTAQADDAVTRAQRLVRIREEYRAVAAHERSNLSGLVEMIVNNPFVTVRAVENRLDITPQGARNLIQKAEGMGWLRSLGTHGRGGRVHWVAEDIFNIMEAPMSYKD